ncbi:hypothetical protein [Rickettsiella endosymbiont of Xylota segnis]|uniref:hypothetical protein n=1 Tax=Rickettsiella endosymbiont of Xylota segnis TaxID=3066238 RepID=UPI0030CC67E0
MKKKKSKNYLFVFGLLLAIFLIPLILSGILYKKNPGWLQHKTINRGTLISSNLNLLQIKLNPDKSTLPSFKHNWFLFYLATAPCRELCKKNLHTMRQITVALGKYRHQVCYGSILVKENSSNIYPFIHQDVGLQNYTISKLEFKKNFSALNFRNLREAYFIADPVGKIILYYPSYVDGEDIYQDLMRLLTISTTTG